MRRNDGEIKRARVMNPTQSSSDKFTMKARATEMTAEKLLEITG